MDLGGGAAFFLEKRATVLKVVALEAVGADLAAPLKLNGVPLISEMPMEAAAVDAATVADAMMEGRMRMRPGESEREIGVKSVVMVYGSE